MSQVTRIAWSKDLNPGKYAQLAEQARRLGRVRSEVWQRYGSVSGDAYLSRVMRKCWRHGHNHTSNQIVVRSDQYTTWTLAEGGDVWLAVPGLERRSRVAIPLNSTVAPTGTLRLILRGRQVEVHYQVDASTLKSAQRPCGTRQIGVDKGYTEVLTDSDGQHHGADLGQLLTAQSDLRKRTGQARAKLRIVRDRAVTAGDWAKAERIERCNLGTAKRDRQAARWHARVRTVTYQAVN